MLCSVLCCAVLCAVLCSVLCCAVLCCPPSVPDPVVQTDFVLHYYDSVCMREGPAPDPKGKYLFACYPHGIQTFEFKSNGRI